MSLKLQANQTDNPAFPLNFLLHNSTILWYKQFTESMCVAGWALFCNSRARPASNSLSAIFTEVSRAIVPATGFDSES
jgi:hypothetical protein